MMAAVPDDDALIAGYLASGAPTDKVPAKVLFAMIRVVRREVGKTGDADDHDHD